ncbi:MAG: acetylglutamate kinase [Clostridia bacterium]|nr:acetylglutamate kinase [Clostridia bacterium]MBP3652997.1 acetylglutamate kinase [Clostridia bacterium]
MNNAKRAEVLVQALPYIQKYANKIVVVKFGGNAMVSQDLCSAVMSDITLLTQVGVKVVLVHGGGPEISDMLKRVNKTTEFVDGLRVTDAETMEIAQMVLCGKINKNLVAQMQQAGGNAIGLCGVDGHMIEAECLNPKLGFVGEITKVNPKPVLDMLNMGYIPVVSSVGCDAEGNAYNINADTAAAAIAAALGAECMVAMTDIVGILKDKDDPSSLISCINVQEAPEMIARGVISGGMIPKVEGCCNAVKAGVKKVFIIDGRVKHSILIELLTNEGMGTMFQ